MNIIGKHSIHSLGYDFIPPQYLPKGKNEYYLRNQQNKKAKNYRKLSALEIEVLVRNRNTSDDWNKILVSEKFNPEQVKECNFFGLVRIGILEPFYNEFHDIRLPIGLYRSTIISCDLGDNVSIDGVNYLSHYIIGNDVMISSCNEVACTDHAKYGNGIIKEGEKESIRVWMELCNENGGRSVLPFNGMLPGDAWMWSRFREDDALLARFKEFTENRFSKQRGNYGTIGDRTVIKNCKIIKDVNVGTDAYFKGANKLKNLTINSDEKRKTQIGEGCELVNGIVGYGCRIFYGVKAVRFVLSSHSQLKYGARLLNSYLGNNSTISCCEVLNSMIFPAHEQHHNNSFLCAALVMGQSNMAAGATIGSNHNSRGADGEIQAGRGFWPGLCVSLKHNSRFASFTIIAKGDYPAELDIHLPFCLVSNNISDNKLVLIPGYWFLYNMYALVRNASKYTERDRRTEKIQTIEFDYLAPDTINEMFKALAYFDTLSTDEKGTALVNAGFENEPRVTEIKKIPQAKEAFIRLIRYYGIHQIMQFGLNNPVGSFEDLKKNLSAKIMRSEWYNAGGQLIRKDELQKMLQGIKAGKVKSWEEVHQFYRKQGAAYSTDKLHHAYTSLLEIGGITPRQFTAAAFKEMLQEALTTRQWICKGIYDSRSKDYSNPFRKMVYENNREMEKVLGRLDENTFINQQLKELEEMKKSVKQLIKKLKL